MYLSFLWGGISKRIDRATLYPFSILYFIFGTRFYVAQAGLGSLCSFTSPCIHVSSAGITDVFHHSSFCMILGFEPRAFPLPSKQSTNLTTAPSPISKHFTTISQTHSLPSFPHEPGMFLLMLYISQASVFGFHVTLVKMKFCLGGCLFLFVCLFLIKHYYEKVYS